MNFKKIFVYILLFVTVSFVVYLAVSRVPKKVTNRPMVVASFYPYYFLAKEIMGTRGSVYNITPPGSEPHDYDLTTGDRRLLEDSDLVVVNGVKLEPWFAEIEKVLDSNKLLKAGEPFSKGNDPHVWLDPILMINITNLITEKLIEIDPSGTNVYRANSSNLIMKFYKLDQKFSQDLSRCQKKDIITSHAAFSYTARRYGFVQNPIAGISPDAEPAAQDLADIARLAREKNINVIFFETLVSPKMANTIASEVGAQTLVLNPLEGLSEIEQSRGENYFTVMNQNLENLKKALVCQ